MLHIDFAFYHLDCYDFFGGFFCFGRFRFHFPFNLPFAHCKMLFLVVVFFGYIFFVLFCFVASDSPAILMNGIIHHHLLPYFWSDVPMCGGFLIKNVRFSDISFKKLILRNVHVQPCCRSDGE